MFRRTTACSASKDSLFSPSFTACPSTVTLYEVQPQLLPRLLLHQRHNFQKWCRNSRLVGSWSGRYYPLEGGCINLACLEEQKLESTAGEVFVFIYLLYFLLRFLPKNLLLRLSLDGALSKLHQKNIKNRITMKQIFKQKCEIKWKHFLWRKITVSAHCSVLLYFCREAPGRRLLFEFSRTQIAKYANEDFGKIMNNCSQNHGHQRGGNNVILISDLSANKMLHLVHFPQIKLLDPEISRRLSRGTQPILPFHFTPSSQLCSRPYLSLMWLWVRLICLRLRSPWHPSDRPVTTFPPALPAITKTWLIYSCPVDVVHPEAWWISCSLSLSLSCRTLILMHSDLSFTRSAPCTWCTTVATVQCPRSAQTVKLTVRKKGAPSFLVYSNYPYCLSINTSGSAVAGERWKEGGGGQEEIWRRMGGGGGYRGLTK